MVHSTLNNLIAGLRIMCGLPVLRQQFVTSMRFILLALVLSIGLFAGLDYLSLDHVIYQDIRGSALLGTFLAVGALLVVLSVHAEHDYPQLPVLLTVVMSCLPWSALLLSLFPFDWVVRNQATWLLGLLVVYFLFVAARCLRVAFYRPRMRTVAMVIGCIAAVSFYSWNQLYFPTVFDSYNPDEYLEEPTVDAEHTFHQQHRLVSEQLDQVVPSEQGVTDYFFLGFGSSDRQTVFESETLYAQSLIDQLYHTAPRSIVLFNNADKINSKPLANTYNLEQALLGIGRRMNIDEDVLVLLLTSHGGDDATLSVELDPLKLKELNAESLESALDRSGIKWRIIVVSACYSGSFIDTLENDNTLIITAASASRNSFGCSSDRELTVFGEAFFKNALNQDSNWVTAFVKAEEQIRQWETEAELPTSNPQIRLGHNLRLKLGLPIPPAPASDTDIETCAENTNC